MILSPKYAPASIGSFEIVQDAQVFGSTGITKLNFRL